MQALSFSRGFLPETDPLKKLPEAFQAWEGFAAQLPKYLMSTQLRAKMESLPAFPLEQLKTEAEHERAMLLLSFIGHAYVFGEKSVAQIIPAILAKPWCALATHLKRPPVLSYASYALHNWYRLDSKQPIELGNIALLQNFLGGMDEEWFILIHIDIEYKARAALQVLQPAQMAAKAGDAEKLKACLVQMVESLEQICAIMDRMPEHCDPHIYYHRVRPYIHGWKNNPALPNGMLYEGCFDNQAQFFHGETGAQSTIVPALDAVLGVQHHEDVLSVYLKNMQNYMPDQHRAFLIDLQENASIRDYVKGRSLEMPALKTLYNQCIDLVTRFRSTHLKYAAQYIQKQRQDSQANPHAIGTGGTPFMRYLGKHESETETHKLT